MLTFPVSLLSPSHCSALGCVHNSSIYCRVETNIPPNSQSLGVMAEAMVASAHIQTHVFNMHHTYRHICSICITHMFNMCHIYRHICLTCTTRTNTYYNIHLINLLESFILHCRERIHFPFGDIVLTMGCRVLWQVHILPVNSSPVQKLLS